MGNKIVSGIKTIEGDFKHCSGQYAIVVGRFNSFVVESLLEGAIDTLQRHGIEDKNITQKCVRAKLQRGDNYLEMLPSHRVN